MFARILRKFHALRPGEYVLIIRNFFLKSCLRILALFGSFVSLGALPHADVARADEPATKAVVIMYHRFGESDFPSTNVTMAQFEAHVAELKSGGYNVISLPKIVAALRSGEALPPKTVGLSGDDAYTSVFTKAWPILKRSRFSIDRLRRHRPGRQRTFTLYELGPAAHARRRRCHHRQPDPKSSTHGRFGCSSRSG